ncbi:autoinducer binding domain-containing protein [uncultured Roseibium sp.]|uniref:helix-turn-helix transcriptional regulator n=1 Tax=uncultured Roseibium sp. TaxID=1936171 RepID=UPI003216C9C7
MVDIGKAIEEIQRSRSSAEAFKVFTRAVEQYGYDKVCFTLMTDHPALGLQAFHGFATSYPDDWMSHYMERDYYASDPVVYRCFQNPSPFFWEDAVTEQSRDPASDDKALITSRRLMNEASDAGLADGIGVPFVSMSGELSAVGLSRDRPIAERNYRELAEVALLGHAFHDKFLSFYASPTMPRMTDRERDVLAWSAEGKTDAEIAIILGVSAATIRFHWNNVFKKMQVSNKVLATCMAIRLGIISVQKPGA